MNIYLAIITTVLVVTQIIRVCQNHIQLRRQHILFKKQLGQLTEMLDARVLPDADAVAKQLQKELGKAVYPFAKVTERSNPNDISYCYRAEAYVVDKGD